MMRRFFLYIFSICYIGLVWCDSITDGCAQQKKLADSEIVSMYQQLNLSQKPLLLINRIDWISSNFLGKPYVLGALGEGAHARYDQYPRYRTDAFDCLTYVNTVLALAFAHDLNEFKIWMRRLNYQHNRYAFLARNHFIEIAQRPRLKDITSTFVDNNGHILAKTAYTLIDQPGWFRRLPADTIRLLKPDAQEKSVRWLELKIKGQQLKKQRASVQYLPFTELFDANLQPNKFVFAQIPSAAVVEIVRPNWDLSKTIGTNLLVSHIGFVFRNAHCLIFREASSVDGRVEDLDLVEYLRQASKSPTIKGVRISLPY